MRRIALLSAILFLSLNTSAQTTQNFVQGSITTGGSSCSPATNCVVLNAIKNTGGVSITISASYSGTMQFEASADGSNYFSLSVTPLNGGSAVTSTTSTQGIWTTNASGLNNIRVRAQAGYSGGAVVMIQGSSASASVRGSSGGGGGSPTGPAGGDLGGTYPNPSVVQVNGAAIPASACDVSTNSSNQFTANTCTGSGNTVLATSPTLTTPNLGTPSTLVLTNATGLPLTGLANQAADTLLANATGSSAAPTAVAFPTSGTNGCAGATNALIYNTTTHALGCNTISSSSVALSSITAASGANTIASGNNSAQIWNWALSSNGVTAFTFGETTAASGTGTNYILQAKTIAGSTASPLNVTNSLNGSQTLSTLVVTPTWNTTGVVDAGIFENVTNTASGTGSLLIDLQVGGTSEFKVDKVGNLTIAGTLITGGSTNGILFTCGTPSVPAVGQIGITPPSSCSNYGNYNLPALPASAGLFHVAADATNVSAVTVGLVSLTADVSGVLPIANGGINASSAAAGTIPQASSSSAASWTATPTLGVDNTTAGTLQLANGSANAHSILGSVATTSNTVNLFATAPTTGDLIDCVTSSTTCTLTDTGILASAVLHGTVTIAQGGTNATSAPSAGAIPNTSSSSASAWTVTPTLGLSGTAGTLAMYPASGNFTTTWGSAATASNTILGFATAPTTGDLVDCVTSSTTCTLTDAGVLAASVTTNSSNYPSNSVIYATGNHTTAGSANLTWSSPKLTVGVSGTAGSVAEYNNTATTTWASGATTSNTIQGFAAVPTTGHLIDCTVTSTTCLLHDSGVVTANVVNASSPGVGLCHFAGSTQTCTSSAVVGSDMTNNTVTAAQLAAQYSEGACTEVWGGSGTSFALTSGDDAISNNSCYNDSGVTRTITAVKCRSDVASNTTTVNPVFGASGSGTTIGNGTALTCGSSLAYSSTITLTNTAWTTGTGINPVMGGTLTGTSIAMIVEYTF